MIKCQIIKVMGHGDNLEDAIANVVRNVEAEGLKVHAIKVKGISVDLDHTTDDIWSWTVHCNVSLEDTPKEGPTQ